ncbi:MAG: dihydrodipicolinate synthase family protein [Chloroflexi bacterium]|nr:dihydrodipicolinate synthase family protein [Chloroflexota bacterium]MBI4505131.1 dihydrodipicolinate synthase family protein [Chloroflexota bacterium]
MDKAELLERFRGVVMIVNVPFDAHDRIDEAELERLVEHQLAAGVNIIQVPQVDELLCLTHDELLQMLQVLVRVTRGRAMVISTASIFPGTANTLRYAQESAALGVDMVKLMPPVHFSLDLNDELLYQHLKAIIAALDVPINLYNQPRRSGINLSPGVVARLAEEFERVVMLEQTNFDQVYEVVATAADTINVFVKPPHWVAGMAVGARGLYAWNPYAPQPTVDIYRACVAGDYARANAMFYEHFDLFWLSNQNPFATNIKYALDRVGFRMGGARMPYPRYPDESRRQVFDAILRRHGLAKA